MTYKMTYKGNENGYSEMYCEFVRFLKNQWFSHGIHSSVTDLVIPFGTNASKEIPTNFANRVALLLEEHDDRFIIEDMIQK